VCIDLIVPTNKKTIKNHKRKHARELKNQKQMNVTKEEQKLKSKTKSKE
jgi:hypothetical protein